MKDISLIAAAVGGFMLSVAAAGIIKAAPVTLTATSLTTPVANPTFTAARFEKSKS